MAKTPEPEALDESEIDQDELSKVESVLMSLSEKSKVDETALGTIDAILGRMTNATRKAVMDLPVFATLMEEAAKNTTHTPGSVVSTGKFTSFKVPYSLSDVYDQWPPVESYVARETIKVIPPGGWVFFLREGVIYDIPNGTPAEQIPEGHGYQLPSVVIGILDERYIQQRTFKREREGGNEFGLGVKYVGPGWPGKEAVINAG